MTDRDRCTDTNPHPAHRTQYGSFGLKDCPGVPMTSREELREERVKTGRLEGDLRSQTRAVREALAERDKAQARVGELLAFIGASESLSRAAELTEELALARRDRDDYREALAVVRDAVERIDRALATYDTAPGEEPDLWQYGRYDTDDKRVITYDGTPRLITPRVLRRPMTATGPWAPATTEGPSPAGCPETVWDGPYSMRCGMGGSVGVCATHGRFRSAAEPTP